MSLEVVTRALATIKQRNASPYDGVLGQPPQWVPKDWRNSFSDARNQLLDNYPIDDVRASLRSFRASQGSDPGLPPLYDSTDPARSGVTEEAVRRRRETHDQIAVLAKVQDFVELGRAKALGKYLGTTSYATLKQDLERERQRERGSKDRPDGLQRVIRAIVQKNPEIDESQLVEHLRSLARSNIEGVIVEAITDEVVEWHDEKNPAEETPLSGLKHRLSRARKKIALTG
jgi:hypothetical protein